MVVLVSLLARAQRVTRMAAARIMAPRLHMVQEVAACVLTVGVLEAWVKVLKGWRRGVGGGGVG